MELVFHILLVVYIDIDLKSLPQALENRLTPFWMYLEALKSFDNWLVIHIILQSPL